MSKSRHHPKDAATMEKPLNKKRRIQRRLYQQWMDRELAFFPLPDPPHLKPLG